MTCPGASPDARVQVPTCATGKTCKQSSATSTTLQPNVPPPTFDRHELRQMIFQLVWLAGIQCFRAGCWPLLIESPPLPGLPRVANATRFSGSHLLS